MVIRKCNTCGKILTKDDDYYSVGEIDFNSGEKHKVVRLHLSKEKGKDTEYYDMTESWCDYCDFDWCPDCIKNVNLWDVLVSRMKKNKGK